MFGLHRANVFIQRAEVGKLEHEQFSATTLVNDTVQVDNVLVVRRWRPEQLRLSQQLTGAHVTSSFDLRDTLRINIHVQRHVV